jgi:DNA-binding MarR family transcriptional regulator
MMHMHHALSKKVSTACACTTLRKASRAVTRLYDDALVETGMSVIQFSILRNIARHEPLPLMRLADLLVMDRTTLYRALGPIDRAGWVSIAEGEGRAKTAMLTNQGRRALMKATSAWEAVQSELLGKIGMKDWTNIQTSLAKVLVVAKELAK